MIATLAMVRKLITFLLSLHYCIVVFSPQSAKPPPFGEPKFRIYWPYIQWQGVEYGDSTSVQVGKQPGGEAAEGIPGKEQRTGNFPARWRACPERQAQADGAS